MGNQVHKSFSVSDMENQKQTSFKLVIDNFSEKEAAISSPIFLTSGCEWYVIVYPKGNCIEDHLSVYLYLANPESLRPGWKKKANYSFIVLNQSGKEVFRTSEVSDLLCGQVTGWGFHNYYHQMLPLRKLKEEGFLENNKLIIKVEVEVVEIVHEAKVTRKEMLDIEGFNVLYSQASYVSWIFSKHPDIAVDFRPMDNGVKTAYMNLLLSLIETMCKPPRSFSETELSNAYSKLTELTEVGFKMDWLKTKLDEVSLEKKNSLADGYRVKEVEERIINLEVTLSDLKVELESEKAKSAAAAKFLSFYDVV